MASLTLAAALATAVAPVAAGPFLEDLRPDLQVLLKEAAARSPRMVEAAESVEAGRAERSVGRARSLPSAVLEAVGNLQLEDRQDLGGGWEESDKLFYTFRVTQPLWQGGGLAAERRRGVAVESLREAERLEVLRGVLLDVRDAYARIAVERASVEAAVFAARLAEERAGVAASRFEAGELAAGELDAAKLEALGAVLAVRRAELSLEEARAGYAAVAGGALDPAAEPTDLPQPPTADLEAAAGGAGQPGISLQRAVYDRLAGVHAEERAVAARRTWPRVSLQAGYSQDEVSYTFNVGARVGTEIAYVGVRADWLLFDGWESRARVRQADAAVRRVEAGKAEAERRAEAQAGLLAARRDVASASASLAAERWRRDRDAVTIKTAELERGIGSATDVRAAELTALQSRVEVLRERAAWWRAAAAHASLTDGDPQLARAGGVLP